jgi:hypothetical protein
MSSRWALRVEGSALHHPPVTLLSPFVFLVGNPRFANGIAEKPRSRFLFSLSFRHVSIPGPLSTRPIFPLLLVGWSLGDPPYLRSTIPSCPTALQGISSS